jgi:hypothetical protein
MRTGIVVLALAAAAAPAPLAAQRGFMVPKPVQMRAFAGTEQAAHEIWSLRAALNVAALQCQFSPYFATVWNYNQLLKHHSAELEKSRLGVIAHFKRLDGAKAPKSFDQYNTRVYNSFSTLDAQMAFCTKASEIGKQALMLKKGDLGGFSGTRLSSIRASMSPYADPLMQINIGVLPYPPRFGDACLDNRGRPKKRC